MNNVFFKLIVGLVLVSLNTSFITYIEVKYPLRGKAASPNAVWPQPQLMNADNDLVYIDPKYFIVYSNLERCDIIRKAIERYRPIFFPPKLTINKAQTQNILTSAYIRVNSRICEKYPSLKDDESYNISIAESYATISANSVWGALHGLETFSQLLFITDNNQLAVNATLDINDSPRFPYRGVLLDTARHYLPVPIMKKHLDTMVYNKFNVLHWHIVDDQSFPYVSKKFPKLSQKGAYSPYHIYTAGDVQDIIEHARLRGIRVIPEFDTPGHTKSWGNAFPEYLTTCYNGTTPNVAVYSVHGESEIFNPINKQVYSFMKTFLKEISDTFPDPYIHLGMDEVYKDCWLSNPDIRQWMETNKMKNGTDLMDYYSSAVLDIVKSLNAKPMVWQDVYDDGVKLDSEAIIEIWKDTSLLPEAEPWSYYLSKVTSDGYYAVLAAWYLNMISYGKYNTNDSVMNLEFFKYYNVDPFTNFTGDAEARKRLIGGEAALWAEFVDGTNSLSRFWPRASAVAERLWSSEDVKDPEDAQFRLDVHRCRLLRRGIPAQPILDGFCGSYEPGMVHSMINDSAFNY